MKDYFHNLGPIRHTDSNSLSLLIENLGQLLVYSNGSFLAHSSHSDHWPSSLFLTLPITLTSRGTPLIISKSLCLQRLLSRKPGTSCIIESFRLNCIIPSSLTVSVSKLTGRSHLRSAQKGEFDTPRIHNTFGSRSFSVAAPPEWNHLPADIRWLSAISTFKRHLKTYLFMTAYSC